MYGNIWLNSIGILQYNMHDKRSKGVSVLIQKLCPYCLRNSYSAYDNPEWICPYCGENIGQLSSIESERYSLLSRRSKPQNNSVITLIKPVDNKES